MHLLLPPSEAKTSGGRGRPLRARPGDGPLADARAASLTALAELVAGAREDAARALVLPDGVAADALAANAAVRDSPTTPALRRYAGVVYDGLAYSASSAAEQRVAGRAAWVFSGLFGVVRGDEAVPDYRVPAKAVLPGLGVAGTYWRPVLDVVVPGLLRRGLVVDLRSSDYAAMWRPRGELAARTVAVRVVSPTPRGPAVVSYTSKFGKGRLAAELVRRVAAGERVTTGADVVAAWLATGGVDGVERPDGGLDLHTA
ncbi:hypothetical protein SAMN05443575_2618 [Jatrophihabitans endophyticus]|uniref:Uncharacterized protein n=1 Tax=Jatrophihabitans endophyticus TaxID=1206085 RepID=A0A1M5M344_9ACTN|nr:peroxide stress protein YaaA [Jatrophihabitans endophyticus]SHG71742.1 hypothetical protein SAMN05443575_2618 [Jatrophihabitans endophyticus]